jgi:hypothetical protein
MLAATIARRLVAMPLAVSACVTAKGSVRQSGHHRPARSTARIASAISVTA